MIKTFSLAACFAAVFAFSPSVWADSKDVGLGVGIGAGFSPTEDAAGDSIGTRFAWTFHVDIPLTDTFYIAPGTTLYDIDGAATTDVDLNFKFAVPLGKSKFQAGFLVGLTNVITGVSGGSIDSEYKMHMGGVGALHFNFVSNLDLFVQVAYKRLFADAEVDDVHGFAGVSFKL